MSIEVGTQAPEFNVAATGAKHIKLSDLRGQNIVLYFYPKDATAGCTREGHDFHDQQSVFKKNDTVILGLSRDSLTAHEKFKAREGFDFDLLSDPDEIVCKLYDVIRDKLLYGKKIRGIERSTFLIDKSGIVRREWRKVKVAGHVDEVIAAIEELKR